MKDLNKIDGLKITNHLTAYNSEWTGFIPVSGKIRLTGAYILTHVETNMTYVGSCKNFDQRLRDHRFKLRNGTHVCKRLIEAYKKSPKFHVEFFLTGTTDEEFKEAREQAFDIEQELMDKFAKENRILNRSLNARQPSKGYKHTPEELGRIRAANIKIANDPIARRNKIIAMNRPEVKATMSAMLKKKWTKSEMREIIRKSQTRPHVIERLRLLNESKKRKVLIDGQIYESVNEAARQLKFNSISSVRFRCNSKKYENWKFVD